jgi:hypothetical protein
MGQSVLKIHRANGQRYAPYGYYGRFEDDYALPVEDPEHIDRFCRDFSIRRNGEPGLSVIIPYLDEEIEIESVIRSVINQYFSPFSPVIFVVIVAAGPISRCWMKKPFSPILTEPIGTIERH